MVMPRRFSSSRRSVSMPVRARTSAVLPWSMCPAVPMMMDFIGNQFTENIPLPFKDQLQQVEHDDDYGRFISEKACGTANHSQKQTIMERSRPRLCFF